MQLSVEAIFPNEKPRPVVNVTVHIADDRDGRERWRNAELKIFVDAKFTSVDDIKAEAVREAYRFLEDVIAARR